MSHAEQRTPLIPAITSQPGGYALTTIAGVHWQYIYDIHAAGSRSESRSGRLTVEWAEPPDAKPGDRMHTPWGTMELTSGRYEGGWLLEHTHGTPLGPPTGKPPSAPDAALERGGTWTGAVGEWGYTLHASAMGTKSERRVGALRYRRGVVQGQKQGDHVETPWGRMYWMDPAALDDATDYEQGFLLCGTFDRPLDGLSGNPVTPGAPVEVRLESLYLAAAVRLGADGPSAHGVRLSLTRNAEPSALTGTLQLDPNACSLDAFGDREGCTKIAVLSIEVTATRQRLGDPRNLGRQYYALRGERLPQGAALILYPHMERCYLAIEGQLVPLFQTDSL